MKTITVQVNVKAPIDVAWEYWNNPAHITHWAFASDDWECPRAENDLKEGGKFATTMAAKDKSTSFDFSGIYTTVVPNEKIEYTADDGRKVSVMFEKLSDDETKITEEFEPENENPEEMQRGGWQAILDNYKKCVEGR